MKLDQLRDITTKGGWSDLAKEILHADAGVNSEEFAAHWIEAGHHIRSQIGDDALMLDLLRRIFPPYSGSSATLYRGENQARWKVGHIGLAWSSDIAVAKMFARGLNSVDSGGVLLTARFPKNAIVCGPNRHSDHLGEQQFTVDPRLAVDLKVLEYFPPI